MLRRREGSDASRGTPGNDAVVQRNDLVPLAEAARRYLEVMNSQPVIPSQAQVDAVARELARRLPVFRLSDGTAATTRGALDSYIALKRYLRGI